MRGIRQKNWENKMKLQKKGNTKRDRKRRKREEICEEGVNVEKHEDEQRVKNW